MINEWIYRIYIFILEWWFVFMPVHIAIGALTWGCYYYSYIEWVRERFDRSFDGISPYAAAFTLLFSSMMGPISLLVLLLVYFEGDIKLKPKLRFL